MIPDPAPNVQNYLNRNSNARSVRNYVAIIAKYGGYREDQQGKIARTLVWLRRRIRNNAPVLASVQLPKTQRRTVRSRVASSPQKTGRDDGGEEDGDPERNPSYGSDDASKFAELTWSDVERLLRRHNLNPEHYRSIVEWTLSGQHRNLTVPPSRPWFESWVLQESRRVDWRNRERNIKEAVRLEVRQ